MSGYRPFDWYETPIYYDMVFDEDTVLEADFLEAMWCEHGRPGGRGAKRRALEPACGTGRLVSELAGRGWKVTGFDASESMLAFARKRLEDEGRRARVCPGRMEAFDVGGPFELAHCLVSTFKYLLTEADARAHLEHVAAALVPGGIYVLGLHLTDYFETGRSRERWTAKRDGVEVTCNIQAWPADRRRRLEEVRSRLVVQEKGRFKRYETRWRFRTYDAAQLRRLLKSVPALELAAAYDFGYEPDEPRELDDEQLDVVLVLRRRGDSGR